MRPIIQIRIMPWPQFVPTLSTASRKIDSSTWPGGGDTAGGIVGSFLQEMTGVSARPFPMNFVRACGAIESFPPRQICLASKATVHRFDNVTRVSKNTHLARLAQRFESNRGRRDLGLLIRRAAQILADRAPETFVPKQRHSRRALRACPLPRLDPSQKIATCLSFCHRLRSILAYHLFAKLKL